MGDSPPVPRFDFRSAGEVLFGRGSLARLPAMAAAFGRRALLVRGGGHLDESGWFGERVLMPLEESGIRVETIVVRGEPDVETVDGAAGEARSSGADLVIGVGGGSVLDAAKAISGLLANGGSALEYMEVVGKGRELALPSVPMIALPTTAGTGTEVTRNAVVTSRRPFFKASMRSSHLIPRVAIVDPQMTDSMPPALTATTGLDAMSQLIESYTSVRANPVTDALAVAGIRLAARSIKVAFADGGDEGARDSMALASLLGGLCLANSGLGAIHGLAAPLGASFPVPHGAACAALLPGVVSANIESLGSGPGGASSVAMRRYAEVGAILCGETSCARGPAEGAAMGARTIRSLVDSLAVPRLGSFGVSRKDAPDIAERALSASSMKGNPVRLDRGALERILVEAI